MGEITDSRVYLCKCQQVCVCGFVHFMYISATNPMRFGVDVCLCVCVSVAAVRVRSQAADSLKAQ